MGGLNRTSQNELRQAEIQVYRDERVHEMTTIEAERLDSDFCSWFAELLPCIKGGYFLCIANDLEAFALRLRLLWDRFKLTAHRAHIICRKIPIDRIRGLWYSGCRKIFRRSYGPGNSAFSGDPGLECRRSVFYFVNQISAAINDLVEIKPVLRIVSRMPRSSGLPFCALAETKNPTDFTQSGTGVKSR